MKLYFTAALFLIVSVVGAQDNNEHHIALKPSKDSLCLKECIQKADWEFRSRTFFMSTINDGILKDDHALASGAGLGILTRPFHGFQVGISGFFAYNIFSSDLSKPDSLTGQPNRYEAGLFDIENHSNKNDLDRLEELYLKYNWSKSAVTIGKINLNTPFFNPQDGRMRPTLEEGVWLSIRESKKIQLSGGWIWDVSPRSTVRWYSIANSIGIYPVGVSTTGKKSLYQGEIEGSTGMAIINLFLKPGEKIKINVWNSFLENVMNTAVIEINLEQKNGNAKLYEGLMFVHQDAINNGGNADPVKTYMEEGSSSNVISAQAGLKTKKVNTNINYTHITGDGRYLMPREWGRDPFYTFLSRERNEGFGNVHALMGKIIFTNFLPRTGASLAYGYYQLPDVRNFRLNKYGMPSYHQLNLELNYAFDKVMKGMEIKALIAGKLNQGNTYDNPKYLYNKVNMLNFNLVIDFKI
jgi:hypothetical protein